MAATNLPGLHSYDVPRAAMLEHWGDLHRAMATIPTVLPRDSRAVVIQAPNSITVRGTGVLCGLNLSAALGWGMSCVEAEAADSDAAVRLALLLLRETVPGARIASTADAAAWIEPCAMAGRILGREVSPPDPEQVPDEWTDQFARKFTAGVLRDLHREHGKPSRPSVRPRRMAA